VIDRGIGIGIGLKICYKSLRLVFASHDLLAVFNLFLNGEIADDPMGTGTMTSTEDAPLSIQRTIPVWTAETGINRDPLHPAAEDSFQFFRKGVVVFYGRIQRGTRHAGGIAASQGTFVWHKPQPVWATPYCSESFSGAVP
jgi:hypothetical protein